MKPKSHAPEDRELNAGTGLALAVLGALMLFLCHLADGHFATLPASFGESFLITGIIIMVLNRSGFRRRQKHR